MTDLAKLNAAKSKKMRKAMLIVDRQFQYKYIFAAMFVGVVSTFVTLFVVLYPLFYFKILRIPNFLPASMMLAMGVAILFNVVCIGMLSVVMTHKIAGPVFGLSRQLNAVQSGRWNSKFKVRTDDELHYLIRKFNGMIDGILTRTQRDIREVREAALILEKFQETQLVECRSRLDKIAFRMEQRTLPPHQQPPMTIYD